MYDFWYFVPTNKLSIFFAAAAILGLIALLPFLLLLLPGALNALNRRRSGSWRTKIDFVSDPDIFHWVLILLSFSFTRVGEDESVSQPGAPPPPVQLVPSKPEFYLRTVYDW